MLSELLSRLKVDELLLLLWDAMVVTYGMPMVSARAMEMAQT